MLRTTFQATATLAAAFVLTTSLVPTARAGRVVPPEGLVPGRLHYIVAPAGNEARYRVREQLVGVDLPNDAVGITHAITGALVVDTSGHVVDDSSKFTVDISLLKSDKDRRDNYIRKNVLETQKFPTVELVPNYIKGVGGPPPASGTRAIELLGMLTVHGVSHPSIWHGSATFAGDEITGTITTAFTFKDEGLKQPSVPIVLSVEDTIKLEYDFHLIKR